MKKLLIILSLFICGLAAHSQTFDYETMRSHPRLLLPKGGEKNIQRTIDKDATWALVHQRIMDSCQHILTQAPVERIKEGKRLLAISRIALRRIYYLSYAYRMTGDNKYALRAEQEMLKVSRFSDWNPTHFLDVGEMTMALAIGYDWLYDNLSAETKTIVREAIIEKGFDAAKNTKHAWFYNTTNNWNSVCNSGLTFGALALFDEIPEISKGIIEKCMETNPKAMSGYGPDGGYPEGFGYWGYGTSFQVLLIAALESALGTDMGLSHTRGFMESARFMEYMTAPSGQSYCFSDAPIGVEANMMMYWFAKKTKDLSLLWLEKEYLKKSKTVFAEDRLLPSIMIFGAGIDLAEIKQPTENVWFNRGETPVFIYRNGWSSPNDTYLGLKGGSPSTSHAHMDAGSFIYERLGVRWAMDLGMQEYITLEREGVDLWNMKQDGQRWDVFRLSNKAHGTLTVNNKRHLVDSSAPITKVFNAPDEKGAEIDLSSTFANDLKQAVRTVTLDQSDDLTIIDRIVGGKENAEVMWVMVTPADAKIVNNKTIELTKNGHKMLLDVEIKGTKEKPKMKVWSNDSPNHYDHPNPNTRRVGFEINTPKNKDVEFLVKLKLIQ